MISVYREYQFRENISL